MFAHRFSSSRPVRFPFLILLLAVAVGIPCSIAHAGDPVIMAVSSHPDDEGIFFGGTMAYYPQVKNIKMVHVSMTSGDWGRPPTTREEELANADAIYYGRQVTTSILSGNVNTNADLFFPRFKDAPTSGQGQNGGYANSIDATWDWWNDGELDGFGSAGQDAAAGKQKAIDTLATYIRTLKPDVIFTHDFDGEYGHDNHKATAIATAAAFDRAADASYVDGNATWQAKKLYMHQSQANGLGTSGKQFLNWLFHDHLEETSIDTDGNNSPDKTPRQIADLGLNQHNTQGNPDVSTVYLTGENFDGHHSEWWGLYRSTVGADDISAFTIQGYNYDETVGGASWSRGDFLQNISSVPEPSSLFVLGLAGLASLTIRRRQP